MERFLLAGALGLSLASTVAAPVKVSERFGFDPENSTKYIQAALDSGLPEIMLDRKSSPWISGPLHGRSNQTLYFEDGVELRAKKGDFPQTVDPLIRYDTVSNVAIVGLGSRGGVCRMRKEDYYKAPYKPSEWRHGIMFVNAINFRAENMTIIESGGDGVDILGKRNRNGVIRRVTCDRNNRQGLSVEGCTGLLIEDCVFMNTRGAPPEAGVDFEPFLPDQPMTGLVMRNCRIENNAGAGVISWSGASDGTSSDYSVTVENCLITGNDTAFSFSGGTWDADAPEPKQGRPRGKFVFRDCVFEKSSNYAISLEAVRPDHFLFEFDDCVAQDNGGGDDRTDVRIKGGLRNGGLTDGTLPDNVVFKNFVVRQPRSRAWCKCVGLADYSEKLGKRLEGDVQVIGPKGEKKSYKFTR